jgi:hypothetical protein
MQVGLTIHCYRIFSMRAGAQFSCFTSTKVQILTQKALLTMHCYGMFTA